LNFNFDLCNTTGQNQFSYFKERDLWSADAILVLYDVQHVQRLKDCRRLVEEVKKLCDSHIKVVKVLGQSLSSVTSRSRKSLGKTIISIQSIILLTDLLLIFFLYF
jgi:hypothetical protein